uniref:Uncharacterized protein n=1 Tax=Tetraselmis sp. GSL018 TaxID=582737 RepID=A0A061S8K2_9CHLO
MEQRRPSADGPPVGDHAVHPPTARPRGALPQQRREQPKRGAVAEVELLLRLAWGRAATEGFALRRGR